MNNHDASQCRAPRAPHLPRYPPREELGLCAPSTNSNHGQPVQNQYRVSNTPLPPPILGPQPPPPRVTPMSQVVIEEVQGDGEEYDPTSYVTDQKYYEDGSGQSMYPSHYIM